MSHIAPTDRAKLRPLQRPGQTRGVLLLTTAPEGRSAG